MDAGDGAYRGGGIRRAIKGWGSYVEPLKNDFLPKERIQMLWLLMGAVGIRAADRVRERSEICCWRGA